MAVQVPIEFIPEFKTAIKSMGTFGTAIKAALAYFAVDKITDGLREVVGEAAKSEVTLTRLAGAMKLTGDFSERNLEAFKNYASQIAKTTKYDDDLILSQFGVAKQFRASNTEAIALVKAATNLSAITGEDLNTSTRLLGQTLDGTAGKIREMVPAVRNLTAEQLANGGAIDLINKLYGGAAAKELDTFTGIVEKLGGAFGDFKKEIGFIFTENEVIKVFFKEMTKLFESFTKAVAGGKNELKTYVADGLILVIKGFGILSQVGKVVQLIFEAIVNVLRDAIRRIATFGEYLSNLIKLDFDANAVLKENLEFASAEDIKNTKERLALYDNVTEAAAELSVKLEGVRDAQARITKETKNGKKGFDEQNGGIRENIDLMKKFMTELEKKQKNPIEFFFSDNQLQGVGVKIGNAAREQMALATGVLGQILNGKQGATKLLSGAAEALGRAFLGVPGLGGLFEQLAQGPDKVREMVREFARAVPDLIQAVAESIPVLIEELGDRAPEIIEKLVERSPLIVGAIVRAMALSLPQAFLRAGAAMVGKLLEGVGQFVAKLLEGAGQFVQKIIDDIGKGLSEMFKKLDPSGGGLGGIGGGGGLSWRNLFPTVTTPGSNGGGGFWGNDGGSDSSDITPWKTTDKMSSTIVVPVQIGQKQMAEVIVDLQRYGYRLVPA